MYLVTMDLANLIVESAASHLKEECLAKQCKISISMHGNHHIREIYVVPMANHVLIQYKTLEFKVIRQDRKAFNEVVEFLLNEIEEALKAAVTTAVGLGIWESEYDVPDENYVDVSRGGDVVFSKAFEAENFRPVLSNYLKNLRMMN